MQSQHTPGVACSLFIVALFAPMEADFGDDIDSGHD